MNARILIACSLTCLSVATLARAQAGGTGPLFASGLLATGDASSTVTPYGTDGSGAIVVAGTTLSPRMRLSAAPCAGISCDVDLTQVLSTSGATFSARCFTSPTGTEGLSFAGTTNADGSCTLSASFCCTPPSAVEWVARDKRGVVVRSGTCAPAQCAFILSPLNGLPPGQPLIASFLSKKGYDYYRAKSDMYCSVSNPCPVTCPDGSSACDVVSIELSIIWCITSPCPGQPSAFSAMEISATGVPSLTVPSCAVSSFSWGVTQTGASSSGSGLGRGKVSYSDLSFSALQSGVQMNESCGGDPDCADLYKRVVVSGLAGTDRGKTIARLSIDRVHGGDGNDILLGDYIYKNVTISVGPGTPSSTGGFTTTLKVRRGLSSSTGTPDELKCVRTVQPATGLQSFSCDASSSGSAQCQLELLAADGTPVHTSIVAATDAVSSPLYSGGGGVQSNPLYDADSRGSFKVKVSVPAGAPVGLITPDGTFVPGAVAARWTPLVPKPRDPISRVSILCDNLDECVIEQVSVTRAALFSGIPVLAMGSASIEILDNSLTCTAPSSGGGGSGGSAGDFGVELVSSKSSLGVGVKAVGAVFTTPSAKMVHKWMAPESIRSRTLSFTNAGPATCVLTGDFGTDAPDGVTWQIVDNIGDVLAQGTTSSSSISCVVTDPNLGTTSPAPMWYTWDPKVSLGARCDSHNVVISGLTPTPITNARGIIIRGNCNREPCPVGWNPSSMQISASGLPSFSTSPPVCELQVRPPGTFSNGETRTVQITAGSAVAMSSFCDMPPPYACAPTDSAIALRRIEPDTILEPTEDFIINLAEMQTARLAAIELVHRDKTARSVSLSVRPGSTLCSSPSGISGGAVAGIVVAARGQAKGGHVTLIKLYDDAEPATGLRSLRCEMIQDQGSPPSSVMRVRLLGPTGQPRGQFLCGTTDHFRVSVPTDTSGTPILTRKFTSDGTIVGTLSDNGVCITPAGQTITGVSSFVIGDDVIIGDLFSLSLSFHGMDSCSVGDIVCDAPQYFKGTDCLALGNALISEVTLPSLERKLVVSNIGSSGQDGVEIKLRAISGGATFEPCYLNGLPPGQPRLASFTGKFSSAASAAPKGYARCVADPIPGKFHVTCSLADPQNPTNAVSWIAYSHSGQVRAQGTFSDGTTSDITVTSSAAPGTAKHAINTKGAGSNDRSICLSFIDEDCDIIWSGGSATGVSSIVYFSASPPSPSSATADCNLQLLCTDVSEFSIVEPTESFKGINQKGLKRCDTVSVAPIGRAVKQKQWLPSSFRRLVASNIGSSGQDGVEIKFFERGDRPTQDQFHRVSASYLGTGWAFPPTFSKRHTSATFYRTGHVTLIKIFETEDPATGLRSSGFDLSALNVQDCIVECLDENGVVVGSFPMVSGVSMFSFLSDPTDPPVISLDSTGECSFSFGQVKVVYHNQSSTSGVRKLRTRILELEQLLHSSLSYIGTCDIQGISLDSIELLSAGTLTPPLITTAPVDTTGCFLSPVTFSVEAGGGGTAQSHWEWRYAASGGTAPGPWIPVLDGMNVNPADGQPSFTAVVSGVSVTMTNSVGSSAPVTGGRREIRVVVSSEGGSSSPTAPAQWIVPCSSVADVASLGGSVGCDGQLTVDDLLLFLGEFFAGNKSVADVAKLGGAIGRDDQLTVDDLLVFLNGLFGGCR